MRPRARRLAELDKQLAGLDERLAGLDAALAAIAQQRDDLVAELAERPGHGEVRTADTTVRQRAAEFALPATGSLREAELRLRRRENELGERIGGLREQSERDDADRTAAVAELVLPPAQALALGVDGVDPVGDHP